MFSGHESDGDFISSQTERIVVPTVLPMKRRRRAAATSIIRELVDEVAQDQAPYVVLVVDPLVTEIAERLSASA